MIRPAAVVLLLCAACAHLMSREVPPPQHVEQPPTPPTAAGQPPQKPAEPGLLPGEKQALAQEPPIGAIPQFEAPLLKPVEKLSNGIPVYVIEREGDGIEAVQLWIHGGASADPVKLPGAASVLAALMETGAAGRSQTEIAAAADAIGLSLTVQATQEALVLTGSAMTTNLQPMTKLVADVALRPNLAPAEWQKVQAQRQAQLLAQRAEPSVGAGHAFRAAALAGTPLSHPIEGTLESVKAMDLAALKQLYASFGPHRAALIAVGGAKTKDVVAALNARFGGWRVKGSAAEVPNGSPAAERPRLVLVDYPAKPQSVLIVGEPSVPRNTPDRLALDVLNAVLGGSFTSRLNQNLREQHGYTYGAGSTFQWGSKISPFVARSSVKTDVTGAALTEMLSELERASTLDEAEVRKGSALLAYQLVERVSHATSFAGTVGEVWLFGLPPDELRTYVPRLQQLTPESVKAAAQRALDPARMTVVVAGDRAKVEPQLDKLKLGTPQLRDPSGRLVQQARQ